MGCKFVISLMSLWERFYSGTKAEGDQKLSWCDLWPPDWQDSVMLSAAFTVPDSGQGGSLHGQWALYSKAQGNQGKCGAVSEGLSWVCGGGPSREMEHLQIQAGVVDTCAILVKQKLIVRQNFWLKIHLLLNCNWYFNFIYYWTMNHNKIHVNGPSGHWSQDFQMITPNTHA